jgi:hypothetical protein
VYVKKLFTPSRNSTPVRSPVRSPIRSPSINIEKVNAKGRKVFKDSKDRTYVKQGDKKVYVKKLFTPRAQTPVTNVDKDSKRREKQAAIIRESPIKTTQMVIPDVPKNYIVSGVKLDCSTPVGLGQTLSTCWFNSTLNGFILAEATAKMIFDKINLLNSSEITALEKDFPTDSCPIILSRKYVFHYFLKIHSGTPITGIKGNISVGLMNKMFTPKALPKERARGKRGGHPSEAAKRILAKVFTPGETGFLRKWEVACPNDFSKYTMVYREGYHAFKKWKTPDTHPLVIKTENGKTKFNLSHIVYGIQYRVGYHATVAYVCGSKKYLYDSAKRQNLEIDWSNPENRDKILAYSGAKDFTFVSYTLYVKEI